MVRQIGVAAVDVCRPGHGRHVSHFPVDGLRAIAGEICDGFVDLVADLPLASRRRLFHDNARATRRIADA